ncbi:MAG: DNA polymerase I [Candidatus Saccharimonadales bacterium]
MSEASPQKLVVIDGKSVFYRGYYAMPNLSTKDGTPTGGVFGFATMALEVLKQLKPDYVAVAWDKPKTNIRRRLELYPAYKAGRKPAPPDFYAQVPVLHELLEAFGWPLYELDDYEADDIMGTFARLADEHGNMETLLVTSDMDLLQVVDHNTKVFALKKGLSNIELYSPESFTAKYGLRVDQFLDLKALKGDSSDNIPGVPGIGEKGAIQLLQQYDTLEGIYENIALIKDSIAKKLEAGKDSAYLSKQLAAIWTDAPVALDLDKLDGHHAKPEAIRDLLQKLEFRSLVRQLPEVMQIKDEEQAPNHGPSNLRVGNVVHISSDKELDVMKLGNAVIVHSRCSGKHGRGAKYLLVSGDNKTTYMLDIAKLSAKSIVGLFAGKCLVGYDVKASLQVLLALGAEALPGVEHDVLVGAFIIDSLRRDQSLSELAAADLDYDGSHLEELDDDEYASRASEIAAIIQGLYELQAKQIKDTPKFSELVKTVEWPIIPVLARMEYEGIELDKKYLAVFAEQINDAISDLEQQIYGYAGREFNIGSPSQLADILFGELMLPSKGIKKGKTGFSTAASELEKLWDAHPVIPFIGQYREVVKLKNTYVDTLPLQTDERSRVHTTFNLTVAQTGRLSSTDPNLQNIPVRTELGKHIRTAFIAGPGKKLVSADYSQFELRLAAAMSGDTNMVDIFNSGADIHAATAAEVSGRQLEDVTKEMRYAAKAVNFGILYGMSAHGLARAGNMTFQQAQEFIKKYFEARGPLLEYLNGLKEQAREQGYVETLFGRRRPMPDIKSSNFIVRQAAERAAMNMPIQGTEADLMKLAMVAVDERLVKEYPSARQLLQIHDSILVECDEKDAEAIAKLLKETMEAIYPKLAVTLKVDTSIGNNWGEL